MLRRWLILICGLLLSATVLAQDMGVVLLHGKWSRPGALTQSLAVALEQQGWPVVQLTMPWAGSRLYDADYASGLEQIADAVKSLRARGIKRVVIAGHSFGANGAIAYAGQGGDLDGIVAIAPGHSPQASYERGTTRAAVDQARELVAAGKGAESIEFVDTNTGRLRTLSARADVFLSYFDPTGMANMMVSARRIPRPVPFLWVVGTQDSANPPGEASAFEQAPPHPLSKVLTVEADHKQTPAAAREPIVDWLKSLAGQH